MQSANGMAQSQDVNLGSSQPATPSPHTESAPAPEVTREERTFRQAEVNDIVRRAKNDAVETYRRMQTERPDYVEQKYSDVRQPQIAPQQPYQPHINQSEDRIKALVAEESQKHLENARLEALRQHQDAQAQKTVQNFWNKVLPGREKYQDFDTVAGDIDYRAFPNVVQLLGDYVENSSDVLYELGKNRSNMFLLESLADRSPHDAIKEVQRMSQAIKDNEAAKKAQLPKEPLSQMRPTTGGTDDGALSVSDYRKKYRV